MKVQYLEAKLKGYLGRRSPPRGMAPEAQVDEIAALVRAVGRLAPDSGYQEWWPRIEDALDRSLVTRAWPTVRELSDAAGVSSQRAAPTGNGDRRSLTFDQLRLLEEKVLPTARRWLGIPGLREHGEKTLAYWGES